MVSTAALRSMTRLGTDGTSIMPMKSLSAFMYALARMFPASLRPDCSIAPNSPVVPALRLNSISTERSGRCFGEQHQRAAGQVAHHVHEHGGHDLVGPADQVGDLLQRPHVDLGHGDHDRAIGHLRQRRGGVAGADVGHLAQRVELQLLESPARLP